MDIVQGITDNPNLMLALNDEAIREKGDSNDIELVPVNYVEGKKF